MKKYHGKKEWTETLYYTVDYDYETGIEKETGGFILPWPEFFEDYGKNSFFDTTYFDDKNDFITYSEVFNVYQLGKI